MRKKTRKISGIFLCLLMVAMAFAVVLPMSISAVSPNANTQVPFEGPFDGNTVPSGHPAWEHFVVSGQANHLGKYTAMVKAYMPGGVPVGWDFDLGLPIIHLPTTATFTAANGDELYAEVALVGAFDPDPTVSNFVYFSMSGTITGGSGRYDGATGSFSGEGFQTSVPGPDNDLVSGTFAGTISTVGSS